MTEDAGSDAAEKLNLFFSTLKTRYGEGVYRAWFADLSIDQISEDTVTLATTSDFRRDRLNEQYRPGMQAAWTERIYPIRRLAIVARPEGDRRNVSHRPNGDRVSETAAASFGDGAGDPHTRSRGNGRLANSFENGFSGVRTDKSAQRINRATAPFFPDAAPESRRASDRLEVEASRRDRKASAIGDLASPLDPRSTFESFAVDTSNAMAHAAARQVFVDGAPRELIYIYGSSGVGKSHLMHAIGHEWRGRDLGSSGYFTYNNLGNGCVNAVLSNSIMTLHQDMLARDLVMIDDIHLLIGKTRTLEEILNLVNAFTGSGRQLVIAGELAPARLAEAGLNERLADRLAGGLAVPIVPGGELLRFEVLRKRRDAARTSCELTDEAIAFIARNFPSSMREAIGAFNQLLLVYGMSAIRVGEAEAMSALHARLGDRRRSSTLEDALAAAAASFDMSVADLTGRAQQQRVVRARHAFVMVGRDTLNESFPRIAAVLRRDHTTAMSSYRRAQALFERDRTFQARVGAIRSALGG